MRYGDTADLALLIDEEGDKSPADVFLSQSPGAVGFLDQQGLLGTLPDDVLDLVAEGFHARDGNWVGFSGRKRVLVYNPDVTDESELPDTVLDLVKPEWKGRIGVAPSNASFQDFVTAMRFKLGDDATAGVAARASPTTTRSRSPTTPRSSRPSAAARSRSASSTTTTCTRRWPRTRSSRASTTTSRSTTSAAW